MKIGQVTMFGDNYGACLQAFALQKTIEQFGHESNLIKYVSTNSSDSKAKSKFSVMRSLGLKGVLRYLRDRDYIAKRKKAYQEFRDRYLKFDEGVYSDNTINALDDKFDKFICGSDMIWSEEFSKDWDFYFLKFASKRKTYSYAPSFGKNELTDNNRNRVKDFLREFQRISLREEGGTELVNSIDDAFNAVQVVDPTLLLNQNDWNTYINNDQRVIDEPYVFVYIFGEIDKERKQLFQQISKSGIRILKLPKPTKKEQDSFPIESIGPIEYLRLFRDSEFVITDTFHGLMFSIIFRKPFVVLKRNDGTNWAKYSDRMTSTLEMFGMDDRYIEAEKCDFEMLKMFDYSKYEQKIEKKRNESLDYIKMILDE